MCKFGFIVSGLPSPVVSGSTYLCQGNKLTLNWLPVGGTWNSNNINDSIYNGIILGLLKGYDTIQYKISNYCGDSSFNFPLLIYSQQQCDSINFVPKIKNDENDFKITPNPNSGDFILELQSKKQDIKIEIIDTLDNMRLSQNIACVFDNKINFNLHEFPSGFYLLLFSSVSYKIIKINNFIIKFI